MNENTLVAILVAIVSALIGFVVWMAQKVIERRNDERLRKEELYSTLLAATIELSSYGNGAPFVIESQLAWLYASDEVLRAINNYLRTYLEFVEGQAGSQARKSRTDVDAMAGVLRLAIRKDIHQGTKIDEKWVANEWMMITSHEENIREYLSR